MAHALPTGTCPEATSIAERAVELHGQRLTYLEAGHRGRPAVVLLHGLASQATTWLPILPLLGQNAHVIALDMLGHGDSAKPRHGDYSVGAHAARLRDLLRTLGVPRATVVGHSFGGGVAMSFAYQFPESVSQLGLIASAGLGAELHPMLRAASLPGAVRTAHTLTNYAPRWLGQIARHTAAGLGLARDTDLEALTRALSALGKPGARQALTHTLRTSVSLSGQRLTATDQLYLLSTIPTLLIAGRHDTCIPHHHTQRAHDALPDSRLVILDAGHFPHHDHPDTVAALIRETLLETEEGNTLNRPAC